LFFGSTPQFEGFSRSGITLLVFFGKPQAKKNTPKTSYSSERAELKPICFRRRSIDITVLNMEACTMDPHFNEYLAAVAGMLECYGRPTNDTTFDSEPGSSIKAEQSGSS
jgi:hypothetical protein